MDERMIARQDAAGRGLSLSSERKKKSSRSNRYFSTVPEVVSPYL